MVAIELVDAVVLVIAVLVEVAFEIVVDVDVTFGAFLYTLRRFPPPQYSFALPAQTTEHPLALGSFPPAATTAPAVNVLPQ